MSKPAIQRRFTVHANHRRCYGLDTSPAPFDAREPEQRPKPAAIRPADVIAREPDPVVRADATAELHDHKPASINAALHRAWPIVSHPDDETLRTRTLDEIGDPVTRWLLVVAAVISVCGSAAELLPVPDETTDATGRAFTPLTEPAAAGNGRVMAVLEPREVGPRDTPRAADGGADDPADAAPEPEPDPAEAAESAVSANATAVEANSEPMPRATASAPTRPTCRTRLDAPRRRADSVMPVGYAFTDHRLL